MSPERVRVGEGPGGERALGQLRHRAAHLEHRAAAHLADEPRADGRAVAEHLRALARLELRRRRVEVAVDAQRRAAEACTPVASPSTTDWHMNTAKLARPTAASAASLFSSRETMAVSTMLRIFCDTMPPMMGKAKPKIRCVRGLSNTSER